MGSSMRPRGRPRIQETADDVVASVLAAAGPRVSTSAYSTREIAAMVGLSQSLVSRAVRRVRAGGVQASPAPEVSEVDRARRGMLRLMSVEIGGGTVRVRFVADADADAHAGDAVRPGVRFRRRTAALTAGLWVAGGGVEGIRRTADRAEGSSAGAGWFSGRGSVVFEGRPGAAGWPEFLSGVAAALDRCRPSEDAVPAVLLREVAARADRGLRGLSWHRDQALPSCRDSDSEIPAVEGDQAPVTRWPWFPVADPPAGERLAVALRGEVSDSGLRPGDRIRPGRLGARTGMGPGAVRGGLTQLAARGLVEPRNPGHAVATVHGADVIDVYAARLQLGQVLLRGAADRPRHRLLPLRSALRQLEEAHEVGVAVEVDQADLRFQRTVAEVSGLRQSAETFHELTLRVQMFIAVLQLDYGPVADRILRDDRRLLAALVQGRGDEAARIWRAKLDHAVRHMCAIAPERFDADLWSRLSGR